MSNRVAAVPSNASVGTIASAGAWVFLGSMALNLAGFAFHAIASRKLGVADYGALYSLISLYTLVTIPVTVLTPVVARYAAEFGALHDDSHVKSLIDLVIRAFAVFGGIYILASVVLALPLGAFLHIEPWEVPIVGVMAAVGIFSGALRAIAQGVHRYISFCTSTTSEGIIKVGALICAGAFGISLFSGALAFVIGMTAGALTLIVVLLRAYSPLPGSRIILDWKRILATTAGAATLTLTLSLIGFADVLIVKHFFPDRDAGLYSAASLCARILFYFVGFVPAILIPRATHYHARGERTRTTLLYAVVFVSIVALVGVITYYFFGSLILRVLVGGAFDSAIPLVAGYAAAMALLALTNTFGSYALATHRLGFVVPLLLAAVGTLGYIYAVHPSLNAVVNELLIGNIVMLVALILPLGIQARAR